MSTVAAIFDKNRLLKRHVATLLLVVSLFGCLPPSPVYMPPADPFEESNPKFQEVKTVILPLIGKMGKGNLLTKEEARKFANARKKVDELVKQGHFPAGYLLGLIYWNYSFYYKKSGGIRGKHESFWHSVAKAAKMSDAQYDKHARSLHGEAISLFQLVARTGYIPALAVLKTLGYPVPEKDLKTPAERRAELNYLEARLNYQEQVRAISSAMLAASSGLAQGLNPSRRQTSTYNTSSVESSGCYFDTDCGIGEKCYKSSVGSTGICGKLTDSLGMPSLNPDATAKTCSFDVDCGVGFGCKKMGGITGICVQE